MPALIPVALFGWIPIVLLMFLLLRPRLATGIAFAAGWCFLPMATYELPGLPDYSKTFATSVGALLGLIAFHPQMLFRLRFSWMDLPISVWCLCPFFSSLTNGLGPYDGLATVVNQSISWGLPYLIGRAVYRTPQDLVSLAIAILICGILYVPLCLWEIRMSPHLHHNIYGFHQHSFGQAKRFGGWRPTVFMQHGLQVALWMASCFVLAFAGWYCGRIRRWRGYPTWPVLLALGFTLMLSKSFGAWLLAFAALGTLLIMSVSRKPWPLLLMVLMVPSYFVARTTGLFSGRALVSFVENNLSAEKASSLEFRLDNEDLLIEHAWKQPIFGWAGWGRNRVRDEAGNNQTVTDGLWIITFGINGWVGLISLYTALLWGPYRMIRRSSPKYWRKQPELAVAVGLATVCIINTIDSLPNAMVIPVFVTATGAVTSAALYSTKRRRQLVASTHSSQAPSPQASIHHAYPNNQT
ncbi:O-antigen ligase family protein [Stieleria sp. TO1_6]|uniref:O-antigen ligase family protein n=1 Tax=Stieleria tagensis TaxID=2956795 RepID=UPI00209B0F60|nr:O-antigen ligase family protein [Stieleria tagensis]MCO8120685.1 O-antigen ligase family protein [Stieleria tagensis]